MSNELEILDNILVSSLFTKGRDEKLTREESAEVLAEMLFEITNNMPGNKLVEVRDYDQIAQKGAFRYSGQAGTMLKEELMPEDVYEGLKSIGVDRHVGPSYLRVKGLLTHQEIRSFFGKQMAFEILDYFKYEPLKKEGFLVFIPNMTGGAWIGDEARDQMQRMNTGYKVWPATPYARETRKPIDVISPGERLVDYVEGLVPKPEDTAAIFCFEELRTAAETTQNATKIYRGFSYNKENGVAIIESCVFDYRHPVGVDRLSRLGVDGIYLVKGSTFFETARRLGYISDSQYRTAMDWLGDPWGFTRKILPDLARLAKK